MIRSFFSRVVLLVVLMGALITVYSNCSSSGSSDSGPASPTPSITSGLVNSSQPNVLPVTVGCGYPNEPCVSVTVCVPGTSQCQTIPNVLVDTGSYGLRLFSQVSLDGFNTVSSLITLPSTPDPANAANVLSECISYAGGNSDWGPLATADVVLGSETASSVPIQIINAGFASVPSDCPDPDQSPLYTGYNGVLGVGLFSDDCGPSCAPGAVDAAANGIYFSCPASGSGSCTGVAVAESQQTTNPVVYLVSDNNGVFLDLPNVPISFGTDNGAGTVSGYLVLGIGTEANNTPSGTTTFQTDGYGDFITTFNGVTSSSSFIDSGSNAYYFVGPLSLPDCLDFTGFYCPSSEMTYSATQQGASGTGSEAVTFYIGNTDYDFSQSNPNFNFADIGGFISSDFDWGLPFFYGRSIYVGIDGTSSPLGTGPLWAY